MKKIKDICEWANLIVSFVSMFAGIILCTIAEVREWGIFGLFGKWSPSCIATMWANQPCFRYGLACWGIAFLTYFILSVMLAKK